MAGSAFVIWTSNCSGGWPNPAGSGDRELTLDEFPYGLLNFMRACRTSFKYPVDTPEAREALSEMADFWRPFSIAG